ncbi:MAG: hypothetical protein KAS96_08010 [Planctomycetes bacterium]|nr:hypothetical protein [Planctomycetota bacterium]
MTTITNETKPTETAISLIILAILVFIACTVAVIQYDYDMGKFGFITDEPIDTPQKQQPAKAQFISKLMPKGFKNISRQESYNSQNLYEKINGKAPLYTETGFKSLKCQRFASSSDENLIFEAYLFDMSTARNAFAVYSVQKRADATDIPCDGFSYKTDNSVYFCSGRFYCEMVGFALSPVLVKAMTEAAVDFVSANKSDTQIEELELFPKENFVPGSIKFYPSDAFGYDGFKDIFSCHYEIQGETVTVFLSKRESPAQAKQMADGYFKFVIDNGGTVKKAQNEILNGKVVDFYDTTEIIFSAGNFTGGVHEAEDQTAAENIAVLLLEQLNKLSSGGSNGSK